MGVECRDLVAFREGRIVEYGLEKVVEAAITGVYALADVYQFGRAGTDGVDTEKPSVFPVDIQFQETGIVAEDVTPGDFAEPGDAGFVWDFLFGQFVFRGTDHRDFGD